MIIRRTLFLILIAVGGLFAYSASAGSCATMGIDIAIAEDAESGCICADGHCASSTDAFCANCLVLMATIIPEKHSITIALESPLMDSGIRMIGMVALPEQPPPRTV